MGKKNEPDVKAIIREAVEAGRLAGMSTARDTYKATERRLYAYRALKQKIIDDTERLEQLKMRGTPEHDKSIVRYSRSGYRMSPEEMLEAVIRDTEAAISSDQYEIDTLDKALKHICCFFVHSKYHRQGIGRALWEYLLEHSDNPYYTVNSSPYAVEVYHRLGFTDLSDEKLSDGMRYTPMIYAREPMAE